MPWPMSQDYNEAIQSPNSGFADAELCGGQPVTNAMGMPLPRSGNFADVYEFVGASGAKWAIKCFTREVPGLQERYGEISKHLLQANLPFIVDFNYLAKGIQIHGQWYPVLKMQWVDGSLLNEFIRNNLDKPALLDGLGQIWVRMGMRLREARMAHADLQHGNVILIPGRKASSLAVKLIDYDGMWVPALEGKKSGEVGHPAYQHPQRLKQGTYSADVDRLPLLAIACALRCLVVGGKPLWDRYDNGDNLLFREADLQNPSESALFKELWSINDAAAHDLTGHLINGLTGPISQVPLLEDVMRGDKVLPLSPVQEEKIAKFIGLGVVHRPAIKATPVAEQAPTGPVPAVSDLLDSQHSPRTHRSIGNLKAGIAVAIAFLFLVIFAALGVSAWLAFSPDEPHMSDQAFVQKDEPQKSDQVFVQKDPPQNEKTPIRDKKPSEGKETKKDANSPVAIRPTAWKSFAIMPTPRSLLATVTGKDGRIYAIGGEVASLRLNTVERYDPGTDTWTKLAPMATTRNHLAAALGPDNRIYVVGGVSSIPKAVEAYNPTTNKWNMVAPSPTARHGLAAVTGPEAYNTKFNTWTTVACMPTARAYLATATGPDGRIYAIGGFNGKRLTTVEAFDTMSNTWATVASMPMARNALTAATGPDGRIYLIGGHSDTGNLNIVEAYNASTNTWTTVANMPTARGQLGAATGRDNRIYVIGGGGNNGSYLNTVEALDFTNSKP